MLKIKLLFAMLVSTNPLLQAQLSHGAASLAPDSASYSYQGSVEASQAPLSPIAHPQRAIASITMSGVYVFQTSPFDNNRTLVGWAVVPEWNVTKHIGVEGDFASLYMTDIYPGQSAFAITAGGRYIFANRYRITPFVYAEGGEGRSTSGGSSQSDWNPLIKAGPCLRREAESRHCD